MIQDQHRSLCLCDSVSSLTESSHSYDIISLSAVFTGSYVIGRNRDTDGFQTTLTSGETPSSHSSSYRRELSFEFHASQTQLRVLASCLKMNHCYQQNDSLGVGQI